MIRRALLAVVLALAALTWGVGGEVASAATPAPAPAPAAPAGGICSDPPKPRDLDTFADALDVTAPARPAGSGLYSKFGLSGFTQSTMFDPGCWDKVGQWIGDHLGISGPGLVAKGASSSGPNTGTEMFLAGGALGVSGVITSVRLAVDDVPTVWRVLNTLEGSLRIATGPHLFVAFIGLSCAVVGLWFGWRARIDSTADVLGKSAIALALIVGGVLTTAWELSAGPKADEAIQASYRAVGAVATGQPDAQTVDAGTVIGDALSDHLLIYGWGIVHFGPRLDTVQEYAPRLFAAQAYTRDEAERASKDPAYRAQLDRAKATDFRAVAGEVKAADPASYDWLAGGQPWSRVGWALVDLVAVFLIFGVVGVAAVIIAGSRLLIRILVGAFPAVVTVAVYPPLQRYGTLAVEWVVRLVFASILACAFLVVFTSSVLTMLGSTQGSWIESLLALIATCAALVWLWKRRDAITRHAGLSEQKRAADRAVLESRAAAARVGRGTRRAVQRAAKTETWDRVQVRAAERWDARHAKADATDTGRVSTATPPAMSAPADPGKVTQVVQARTEQARMAKVSAAKADPTFVTRKASAGTVTSVASALSSAPATARSMGLRESAEITRRTAHAATKKAATQAVTKVAARSAVKAATKTITASTARAAAPMVAAPAAVVAKVIRK